MKKELEAKLQAEFPTFFKDLYGDPAKTCMHWGITCSDGWYSLIYEICKKIKGLDNGEFYFLQIKEKWGGLQLYATGGTSEINKLLAQTEAQSFKICEICGTKDDVTVEGSWIQTLCKKCRKK